MLADFGELEEDPVSQPGVLRHAQRSCIIGAVAIFEEHGASHNFLRGVRTMTYVITEPCITVKDAACVDVCPVDCIHPRKDEPGFEGADQLYIDPDECIDCGAC